MNTHLKHRHLRLLLNRSRQLRPQTCPVGRVQESDLPPPRWWTSKPSNILVCWGGPWAAHAPPFSQLLPPPQPGPRIIPSYLCMLYHVHTHTPQAPQLAPYLIANDKCRLRWHSSDKPPSVLMREHVWGKIPGPGLVGHQRPALHPSYVRSSPGEMLVA